MLRQVAPLAAAVTAAILFLPVGSVEASTPSTSSVTVPTTAGQTVTDTWSGTIQPGANAASDCSPPSSSPADEHVVTVNVPPGAYDSIDATFAFSINWTPQTPTEDTADEILTVIGPDGEEVGSSDGSSTTEKVVGLNLPPGGYHVLACGFANVLPQQYTGTLEIKTTARAVEPSLPSAPAQGLQFSAAVPADPQRDESEPLIEIDRAGNIYTCGPTGFSNAADYAQVSTDGGDQFHLLGTPPRGQQGAGGGGDCVVATGQTPNGLGNFQYAYAGLGPLTGFATSTSPNNGHNFTTSAFGAGETDEGGLADRQWMTFLDDHTVLLSYNQQQPRNTVVQKSTDGGLTYSVDAARAARNTRFPGPMHFITPSIAGGSGIVYFGWDRGGPDGDHINLSISQDGGVTWTDCLAAVAPANAAGFVVADHDSAGNIYMAYGEAAKFHTYLVTLTADKVRACDQSVTASTALPTKDPGFSTPVQVDRDAVRSTVFPWLVAGPTPGRVAVAFYGTESDGNPNSGNFKASWDVYVNQSLNALSPDATFSQVKATTHPFHYDSICLNGLGCDLSVPPGDRSLADFFSIGYDPITKKLMVGFDRGNKKPDESAGHVARPMVVTQIAGPSDGGGTIGPITRPVLRTESVDPTGDALSSYSVLAPAPPPPTKNEPAADFQSVSVAFVNGNLQITMKLANLSNNALNSALLDTGSQSLLWVFDFVNGFQPSAASARWNPAQGFTFGFNDYTTGSTPCETTGPVTNEKCVIYPGTTPIQGQVQQGKDQIVLTVPGSLLRALSGPTGPGQRPTEVAATAGSRLYDGTAFSLGNTTSPTQDVQSWLYPLDNTPAMDFVVPGADLSITKTDAPDPVHSGQNLTYTIVVTNNGPSTATGVTMTDQLPKNAGFASATTTQGSCSAKPSKATVTCSLGSLASGASATITIVVKSPTRGTITNTASVAASSPPDPNTNNNTATATTTVVP